jgi:hypothetical protein
MTGPGVSKKAERDQLREQLRGYGCATAQIAQEMMRRFGVRPRTAWRYALGWPQWRLAQEFNRANPGARLSEARISEYESWPHGGVRPTVQVLARLATVFGPSCGPGQLVDAADLAEMPDADRLLLARVRPQPCDEPLGTSLSMVGSVPAAVTYLGQDEEFASRRRRRDALLARDPAMGSEEEIVMAAADQSAEFGAWAEGTNVGPVTIEQLHDQVRQLADGLYNTRTLFDRALLLRNRVFDALEGHQYPDQSRDLYVVAGWLCAMLCLASNDLGQRAAAEAQARMAWLCGEIADHNDLRAWARAVHATAAYWRGDVLRAVQLSEHGLRYARTGTAALQLTCQIAANRARLGHIDDANAALNRVRDERERADTAADLGELFSCHQVRQYGFTGTMHLRLDQPANALSDVNDALVQAEHAPDAFHYSTVSLLRLDGVRAHLRLRQLDAANDMIRPVLAGSPDLRDDPIIQRAAAVSDLLSKRQWQATPLARQLQEEIAEFRADSAARRIPPPAQ